ncbi:hypothetical protein BDW71DRAFT_41487 [Aspergillus fruticulosus]
MEFGVLVWSTWAGSGQRMAFYVLSLLFLFQVSPLAFCFEYLGLLPTSDPADKTDKTDQDCVMSGVFVICFLPALSLPDAV